MTLHIKSKKLVTALNKDTVVKKEECKDIYQTPRIIKSWNIVISALGPDSPPTL